MHFNEHVIGSSCARGDRQLANSIADAGHRVEGIDNEIDDYLLQLHPISRDERQVVCKPGLQPDPIPLQFGLNQGDDLANSLVNVEPVKARGHLLYERPDAADNLAGASAIPDDPA